MSILSPALTIAQDDFFLLTYNGSYARDIPVYERERTNTFCFERCSGPLPVKGFEFERSTSKADSLCGMEPDETRLLRFETVANFFGDPRAGEDRSTTIHKGMVIVIPTRVSELRRLGVRYGCYTKPVLLPEAIPDVTIRTHATDQRITFPAQDPENAMAVYGHIEDGREVYDIATLLAQSRRQQELLQARIEALEAAAPQGDDVAIDAPPEFVKVNRAG